MRFGFSSSLDQTPAFLSRICLRVFSIPLGSKVTYYLRKLISSAKNDFCSFPKDRAEHQIGFDTYNNFLTFSSLFLRSLAALKVPWIRNKPLLSKYYVSDIMLETYTLGNPGNSTAK
jgi:hypothetical protein